MRIIKFFVLGLFIVGHLSCSKDDDGSTPVDIIGEWTLTEGSVEPGSFELDLGGMTVPVRVSGSFLGIDDQNRLNFNEDKTFTSATGNLVLELELDIMGTVQTERIEADNLFGGGTWELRGKELKIQNDNGTTIPYQIDSFDGNHMIMKSNVSHMELEGGSNPFLENMDITIKMKFDRI